MKGIFVLCRIIADIPEILVQDGVGPDRRVRIDASVPPKSTGGKRWFNVTLPGFRSVEQSVARSGQIRKLSEGVIGGNDITLIETGGETEPGTEGIPAPPLRNWVTYRFGGLPFEAATTPPNMFEEAPKTELKLLREKSLLRLTTEELPTIPDAGTEVDDVIRSSAASLIFETHIQVVRN